MKITEQNELFDKVITNYNRGYSMLNSLHFDFDVEMGIMDILKAYEHIQLIVNNDRVIYPSNLPVKGKYVGNCEELLKWLGTLPGFKRQTAENEEVNFIF